MVRKAEQAKIEVAYADGRATLLHADVFDGLAFLKETGIRFHTVCCSPPYW